MLTLRTDTIGLKDPIEIKLTVAKKMAVNNIMIHALKGDIGGKKPKQRKQPKPDDKQSVAKVEADSAKEMEDDNAILVEMLDFIQMVLGLTAAQRKKVSEFVDLDELSNYVNYVYFKSRGLSDEEADALKNGKSGETGPKEA